MVNNTREHQIACLARELIAMPAYKRDALKRDWLNPRGRFFKGEEFVAEVRAAIHAELDSRRADAKARDLKSLDTFDETARDDPELRESMAANVAQVEGMRRLAESGEAK